MSSPPLGGPADAESAVLEKDERWALALRVAASPEFQKAKRLREFLLYVCRKALTNRKDELREHLIAIDLFGRQPGYNPAEDNIVRVEARELRRRLDTYFYTVGRSEPIRITIPKGGYVPCFEPDSSSGSTQIPGSVPNIGGHQQSEGQNGTRPVDKLAPEDFAERPLIPSETTSKPDSDQVLPLRRRGWLLDLSISHRKILVSALVLGLLGTIYLATHLRKRAVTGPASSSMAGILSPDAKGIWSVLFPSANPIQIVVSDSCLVLSEEITHKAVRLADYSNFKYMEELRDPELPLIAPHHYTEFADLLVTLEIQRTAIAQHRTIDITYARDLRPRDLDNHNVVFLGSAYSDPWVQEFDDERQFRLAVDPATRRLCFSNESPRPGEANRFCTSGDEGSGGEAYGLVTFLPNLQHRGNILIVEGTNAEGTEAAGGYLIDSPFISEVRQRLGTAGVDPLPYFQALLKTADVHGAPGRTDLIACKILHPPNP